MDYNLPELIKNALTGSNNTIRNESEKVLQNLIQSNSEKFLLECAVILANEQIDTMLRQGAGALIKRVTNTSYIKDN